MGANTNVKTPKWNHSKNKRHKSENRQKVRANVWQLSKLSKMGLQNVNSYSFWQITFAVVVKFINFSNYYSHRLSRTFRISKNKTSWLEEPQLKLLHISYYIFGEVWLSKLYIYNSHMKIEIFKVFAKIEFPINF